MLGIRPERMLTFPKALQDILGFRMCKGAGHMFGLDPRNELERRFAPGDAHDAYAARRDTLHGDRWEARRANPARRG